MIGAIAGFATQAIGKSGGKSGSKSGGKKGGSGGFMSMLSGVLNLFKGGMF